MTADAPGWRVLGASVAGSGHLAAGRGCDDAHLWRLLPNGTLLLVAADGAGSAPRGADGAARAVRAALDALSRALEEEAPPAGTERWRTLLLDILEATREALAQLASEQAPGISPSCHPRGASPGQRGCRAAGPAVCLSHFATTLLVAAVTDAWVAALQVADGAIVVQDAAGLGALTRPEHGEYLNETVFVTSAAYRERAQVAVRPRDVLCGMALFTDGIETVALHLATGEPHPPFFAPLFAFAADSAATEEELVSFLASPRLCARTDDDKTLLLAVPA
jgi:hypothetical protein